MRARRGRPTRAAPRSDPAAGRPALFIVGLLCWLGAANAALYLAFVSPAQAMTPKHLAALWPLCAFVPILALTALPLLRVATLATYGGALAVSGAVAALGAFAGPAAPPSDLADARRVVVPSVARGILPRVVLELPPDARVFAADQRHLLSNRRKWLRDLRGGGLYVSELPEGDPRFGDGPEQEARLERIVARVAGVEPGQRGALGMGRVLEVAGDGCAERGVARGCSAAADGGPR